MPPPAPKIDSRTAPEIIEQAQDLLKRYTPDVDSGIGVGSALVGIFARFAELIITRLNQVPQKNFLAFLDLLGNSPSPPQPARAPLTFSLAVGSTADGVVPAGTQVAAAPAEGEKTPVIFETERELVVTAARLTSIFTRNPEQDEYADYSSIVDSTSEDGVPLFLGNRNIEHIFYLAHDALFSYPSLKELRLNFTLDKEIANPDPRSLTWEVWDETRWAINPPSSDGTLNLTKSGDIVFTSLPPLPRKTVERRENRWLRCRLLTSITPATEKRKGMVRADQLPLINQISMRATSEQSDMPVEQAFLNNVAVDLSKEFFPFGDKPRFADTLYLALEKAYSEAGSKITIEITLLNPVGDNASPIPTVAASNNISLKWEFWDGRSWFELGTTGINRVTTKIDFSDTTQAFTRNGADGKTGVVKFTLPAQAAATTVNGVEGFWVRVRIVSGNYGEEARYELILASEPQKGYTLTPATFKPPSISSINVNYNLVKSAPPETVLTFNDFAYTDSTDKAVKPFEPTTDARPTLYLGFTVPPGRKAFPNRKISIFSDLDEFKQGDKLIPISPNRSRQSGEQRSTVIHKFLITNPMQSAEVFRASVKGTRWGAEVNLSEVTLEAGEFKRLQVSVTVPEGAQAGDVDRGFLSLGPQSESAVEYAAAFETFAGQEVPSGQRARLAWEYSNQAAWSDLLTRDETESFTRQGLIEFLAPPDFATRSEFGLSRYWLRVVWESGAYLFDPLLHRMLLNTAMAAQSVTIKNEILGSSNADKNQKFLVTRSPVLAGQRLEVREPEMPSATEQERVYEERGGDAISVIRDTAGRPKEIWVSWTEVPDFYGSGARDRHYMLDHLKGEVRFGDGLNGLIPPGGVGNIRMTHYKTGGGTGGNKPAGAITQLKTTIPYVERVTNYKEASGGADAETMDSLLERAPRMIRHRGRAVTTEDFEDLAVLASPGVARAKCVPLFNLAATGGSTDEKDIRPGTVSLVIVPRSTDPKPSPGIELIQQVREFIGGRKIPVAELVVVGPEYIRVEVAAEIAITSMEVASEIELVTVEALSRFLHPLTGGLDGRGWDFGRKPHRSDLYALIEAIPGVDHVRSLEVKKYDDRTGDLIATQESDDFGKSGRFLVYSGTHRISLRFEES